MTALILITVLYVIPLFLMRRYTRKAHSEKGRYSNLTPDAFDVFLMLTPVLNIGTCMMCWIAYYPIKEEYRKTYKTDFIYRILFGIKPKK
jgi:hypothetical protein